MRIGMITWGSTGDVRPFIALAGGLVRHGHQVNLAIVSVDNKDFSGLCAEQGVNCLRVPQHVEFDHGAMRRLAYVPVAPLFFRRMMDELLFPYISDIYAASRLLARNSDLLIGHFVLYPAKLAALVEGCRYASVTMWPGLIPCAGKAPEQMPDLGRFLNNMQWKAVQCTLDLMLGAKVRKMYAFEGRRFSGRVLPDALYSDELNLVAASRHLWQHRPAEPPHRLCGFLGMDEKNETWEMPGYLKRFLAEGDAPVYMTMGTVEQVDARLSLRSLRKAALIAGCRTVIQTSLPGMTGKREKDILYVGKTPHQYVFPLCRAAVISGGAGNVQTALKFGLPPVVIGFSDEQMSWGKAVYRCGAGLKPLSFFRAKPKRVGASLAELLQDGQAKENASRLGRLIREENGVQNACRMISDLTGHGI